MDEQLPESLRRPESIPYNYPTVESIRVGRRVISVFGCYPACCKFGVDQRRRKSAETGLLHLKAYLITALLLSPSVLGEELYLYLAVTLHAVSSTLIREEGRVQKSVYYTSWALRGAEAQYPQIEKLAFALITSSRKLRHYFQAHVINVMMDHPLKKAMNKLEAAGRLIQWAVELNEFDIKYLSRHAIKAQALADFIAEFTPSHNDSEVVEDKK